MKVGEDPDHGALDDREQHHRVRPEGRGRQEKAGQHHLEGLHPWDDASMGIVESTIGEHYTYNPTIEAGLSDQIVPSRM